MLQDKLNKNAACNTGPLRETVPVFLGLFWLKCFWLFKVILKIGDSVPLIQRKHKSYAFDIMKPLLFQVSHLV